MTNEQQAVIGQIPPGVQIAFRKWLEGLSPSAMALTGADPTTALIAFAAGWKEFHTIVVGGKKLNDPWYRT